MSRRTMSIALPAVVLTLLASLPALAGRADAATVPHLPHGDPAGLRVGVGQADITPTTGSFKGGWANAAAIANGQHTRLYAHAIVLQRGSTKVALVSEDLAFLGAGMIRDAAALLPGRGFSEANIIDSATHTHSSQSGFMNYEAYNSVLPDTTDLTTILTAHLLAVKPDQTMYNFMTRQLAAAIKQADDTLAPGTIGWGHTDLYGVTQNRSLEAHLADHGIQEKAGTGNVSQDPGGYPDTIDPAVELLRVDRLTRKGHTPIGVFTTFANHGTVDKGDFSYYSADHQGAAERLLAGSIRAAGHLPASAPLVTAFANSDAGDMSSGLQYSGPADAEYVGRQEAAAMLNAWRAAGTQMSTTPVLDLRWTRFCMCGQTIDGHATDSRPWLGSSQATGSEEGRSLLGEIGFSYEGQKLPFDNGPQGDKVPLLPESGNIPNGLPLTALRIGDRMLVTWPGEATIGVGEDVKRQVLAATASTGISRVVFVGYAGEYSDYWTTPAEYEAQHYEGGSTVYGEYASPLLESGLLALARSLAAGQPAPAPFASDPNQGLHVTAASYGNGAASGTITGQPHGAAHLGHPTLTWNGGASGLDRPVDHAFVTIQKHQRRGWRNVADDLGLQILWGVDGKGHYTARWETPLDARPGTYRFVVTAKRYSLTSQAFGVGGGAILSPRPSSDAATVQLGYPQAVVNSDWTYRPPVASSGTITFTVDGRSVAVSSTSGTFPVPAGHSVSIAPGAAHDRYGNTNPTLVTIR